MHALDPRTQENIVAILPARREGLDICRQLRQLRETFAKANGIPYTPCKCPTLEMVKDIPFTEWKLKEIVHCSGTCLACDEELKYLNREAEKRGTIIYPAVQICL